MVGNIMSGYCRWLPSLKLRLEFFGGGVLLGASPLFTMIWRMWNGVQRHLWARSHLIHFSRENRFHTRSLLYSLNYVGHIMIYYIYTWIWFSKWRLLDRSLPRNWRYLQYLPYETFTLKGFFRCNSKKWDPGKTPCGDLKNFRWWEACRVSTTTLWWWSQWIPDWSQWSCVCHDKGEGKTKKHES